MIDAVFNVAVFAALVLCIAGFGAWAHKPCAQVTRLARITSRFGDLPDLYTFECRACGVSHIETA
jgi:hypothetical protein